MGKPKEFKMPKGKILMGKGSPKPKPGDRTLPKRGGGAVPKGKGGIVDPKRNPKPDGRKRPIPMPKPKPGGKRPMPMPKPKPGKPAPKGGTVIERRIENNEQYQGGPLSLAELRKRIPDSTVSQSQAKRPVDPNKVGVAYGKSKKQVKTFRGR